MVLTIYTVGHSTHPIQEFVEILRANKIETLVDVRTIAKSRHNPQFEQHALDESLAQNNIEYIRLENLGGLRPTTKESINTAWRNKSFRGYADYMQTDSFTTGINELISVAKKAPTAIMCAEAVPWRCHRSLIGDALLVRNIKVLDIMSKTSTKEEKITDFAKVRGETITYPGEEGQSVQGTLELK